MQSNPSARTVAPLLGITKSAAMAASRPLHTAASPLVVYAASESTTTIDGEPEPFHVFQCQFKIQPWWCIQKVASGGSELCLCFPLAILMDIAGWAVLLMWLAVWAVPSVFVSFVGSVTCCYTRKRRWSPSLALNTWLSPFYLLSIVAARDVSWPKGHLLQSINEKLYLLRTPFCFPNTRAATAVGTNPIIVACIMGWEAFVAMWLSVITLANAVITFCLWIVTVGCCCRVNPNPGLLNIMFNITASLGMLNQCDEHARQTV